MNAIRLPGLRDEPLSVDEVMRAVTDPAGTLGVAETALIDEVKSAVPIWKQRDFGNGESERVNCA